MFLFHTNLRHEINLSVPHSLKRISRDMIKQRPRLVTTLACVGRKYAHIWGYVINRGEIGKNIAHLISTFSSLKHNQAFRLNLKPASPFQPPMLYCFQNTG